MSNLIQQQGYMPSIQNYFIVLASLLQLFQQSHVLVSAEGSDNPGVGNSPTPVLWNAALCKPADQIDVFRDKGANLAVDGNHDPGFYSGSCFHTAATGNVWWMVDLLDEYLVHIIVVTNRLNSAQLLSNTRLDLFTTDPKLHPSFPDNTNGILCAEWGPHFTGTKTFECSAPTYARYVKMYKTGNSVLHVCEIEVLVSERRGDRQFWQGFNIFKDSTFSEGVDLDKTVTETAIECVMKCAVKGGLCNGCVWTTDSGECQMMTVNPVSALSALAGTVLYREPRKRCG